MRKKVLVCGQGQLDLVSTAKILSALKNAEPGLEVTSVLQWEGARGLLAELSKIPSETALVFCVGEEENFNHKLTELANQGFRGNVWVITPDDYCEGMKTRPKQIGRLVVTTKRFLQETLNVTPVAQSLLQPLEFVTSSAGTGVVVKFSNVRS